MEEIFTYILGYLGVFVSSIIGSATIIFPAPSAAIVIASGAILNPFLVSIIAAAGFTIGELTGYALGYGGESFLAKRKKYVGKWQKRVNKLSKKYRLSVIIFVFALLPTPFDLIGIFAGSIKYDIRKFIIATFLGKFGKSLLLAYVGFFGLETIIQYFL